PFRAGSAQDPGLPQEPGAARAAAQTGTESGGAGLAHGRAGVGALPLGNRDPIVRTLPRLAFRTLRTVPLIAGLPRVAAVGYERQTGASYHRAIGERIGHY